MSTTLYTYKVIVKILETWANNHPQLKRFSYNTIQEADLGKSDEYAWMHVAPSSISYDNGSRSIAIDVMIADLVKDKDGKPFSELSVINNCHLIFEDLLSELENGTLFGDNTILQMPISVTPFFNSFSNNLAGVEGTITIEVDFTFNQCDAL